MILIIGGMGFLGRHLVSLLNRKGLTAAVVTRTICKANDRPNDSAASVVDQEAFGGSEGDRLISAATAVVYLASQSVPSTFATEPWREVSANVEPAARLFMRIAARNPAAKIVLVSSGGTVYGQTSPEPVSEEVPTRPISGYGLGKVMLEEVLAFVGRTQGCPYNVLRVSNAVGRWQTSNTQGIVSVALRATRDRVPVQIYGDGLAVRDYVDADDVARALLMACLDRQYINRVWNVGSGIGRSVAEILHIIEDITGRAVPVRRLQARPMDVATIVLNCERIKRDLNWTTTRPIEETIVDIWYSMVERTDSRHEALLQKPPGP